MSSLPETVSVLEAPNGSKVYLVGTAHFSKESAIDVQKTIQHVRPNIVLLELCPERRVILNMKEDEIIEQAKDLNWDKVKGFMETEGRIAGITHAVFIKISANLMEKLGVAPGGEFRMGFEEGEKMGSLVVLGDRSIRLTFKRALRALPIWQQLRLFYMMCTTVLFDLDISLEDVEKMKNSDMVEMLTGELARELPALSHVFLNERDLVLTNSLMNIANCLTDPCGPPVNVVGVVGIGHVNGIKEHWMGTECRDISSLLTVSEPHWSSRLFWCYFQWCMVSMFNVGLYWVGRTCLRAMARRFFSIF